MSQTFACSTLSRRRSMELGPIRPLGGGSSINSWPFRSAQIRSRSDRNMGRHLRGGPLGDEGLFDGENLSVGGGDDCRPARHPVEQAGGNDALEGLAGGGLVRAQLAALPRPAVVGGG